MFEEFVRKKKKKERRNRISLSSRKYYLRLKEKKEKLGERGAAGSYAVQLNEGKSKRVVCGWLVSGFARTCGDTKARPQVVFETFLLLYSVSVSSKILSPTMSWLA